MVQLFLDCVDRTNEQLTAFVSCQERPMHRQTQTLRVVDAVVMVTCGDATPKNKIHQRFENCVAAPEGDHVPREGNERDKWKIEVAVAVNIWRNLVSSFQVACTRMKYLRSHIFSCCLRHAMSGKTRHSKACSWVPSHWTMTVVRNWKLPDKQGLVYS